MRKTTIPGPLCITAAAILWSTSGLFIKFVDCHPVIIAGGRSLIAAVFLLSVRALFQNQNKKKNAHTNGANVPPMSGWIREWRRILGNKWVWYGGAAYAATMILFVVANKLTISANVILLQYSAPIWTALLAWAFLKERPLVRHWIGLVLATGGLLLFFSGSLQAGVLIGNVVAVLSGIVFGATSVFMRMTRFRTDGTSAGTPADSMIVAHLLTALCMIPFLFTSPPELTTRSVLALLFMGVCQIGIASLLFSAGIVKVPAVSAMLIASIEPILNPVWVLLATGEKPGPSAIVGGAIIISAVVISSLRFSRPHRGTLSPERHRGRTP
ncbi:MAG: DMT family transporter [Spirochaetaceae bacterium]|jgi:drug/metabolite transporter (DMT)-like permease|nr:DMT family transporter [Spirochaetaceae bacterium]